MKALFLLFSLFPLLFFGQTEEEALFLRRIADFWEEGEYQIAKNQMQEFMTQYPQSSFSDALSAALGDLFLRENQYSNALSYYTQVQSKELSEKIFFHKMQCLYQMQWYATLREECEAKLEKQEDLKTNYFLALSLYQQAISLPKDHADLKNLVEKAIPIFEKLYESEFFPDIAQPYANLLSLIEAFPKATEVYLELMKQEPEKKEDLLFEIALMQSEYDASLAIETFKEVVKLQEKRAKEASYNLMVLSFEAGMHEELTEDFLSQIPDEQVPVGHLLLARSLIEKGQPAQAIESLKTLLKQSLPIEIEKASLISLLEASYQAENLDALNSTITRLEELNSEKSELFKAYFSRAQLLKQQEKFKEAQQELSSLLEKPLEAGARAQTLFELSHLQFQEKNWQNCYENCQKFLKDAQEHELAPFIWSYLIQSSHKIALQNPAHQIQFISDLHLFLSLPMEEEEKDQWQLMLAKIYYEMKDFPALEKCLKNQKNPNATLLLALCEKEAYRDLEGFCKKTLDALQEEIDSNQKITLLNKGEIYLLLYNAYLDLSKLNEAADALYSSFTYHIDLKEENLLWLANHYFAKLEEEKDFHLATKCAFLYEKCKTALQEKGLLNQVHTRLAKTYMFLGKIEEAIELLSSLENPQSEAKLCLAEIHLKKGDEKAASSLFSEVIAESPANSIFGLSAKLEKIKLSMHEKQTNKEVAASELKNLVLQKRCDAEPVHLEAALEYIELMAQSEPQKKKILLEKTKQDFAKEDDLLSKEYHAFRKSSSRKDQIYQSYMKFIDAEILAADAKMDPEKEKDLQAKSKTLLLQIMQESNVSCLKKRIEKSLADAK